MWGRLLAVGCLVACSGDAPPSSSPSDAPVTPDVGSCTAAESSCMAGDELHVCDGPGAVERIEVCTWGCSVDPTPRCQRMTPSSNGAVAMDLDPANFVGLADFSLSEPVNGDLGKIGGIDAATRAVNYRLNANGVAVFRFKSLSIGAAKLVGTRSIVLVADGPITINGPLDVTGQCDSTPEIAGPGGGNGGETSGAAGALIGAGAGGGGGGAWGGDGGNSGDGDAGGTSTGLADLAIPQLRGGAGGGAGVGTTTFEGGGGGGAVQLISNTKIEFIGTGSINAGGCGGRGGATNEGGGGGAGGTILLEAPTVRIGAPNAIAANGGGGGGATDGQPGSTTATPAAGGSTSAANAAGGAGGAGATITGATAPTPAVTQKSGGGGGGVGRIRINTRGGTGLTLMGTISPAIDNVTSSQGTVTVQ